MTPISHYRTYWLPDLIACLVLAAAVLLVSQFTDLDIRIMRHFYDPGHPLHPWTRQRWPLWSFFYHSAPWLTGILAFAALCGLVRGTLSEKRRRMRLHALFILLVVALGPGLIINAGLKNYWGRPRPRQVTELGGTHEYRGPLEKGISGMGKSFPSGHASVGFVYCVFYFIHRRRKKLLAFMCLGGSLALGVLMGVGRMSAGGHFLSDTLMSGCIVFLLALVLYYFVLRIPQREAAAEHGKVLGILPRHRGITLVLLGFAGLGVLGSLLFSTPVYEDLSRNLPTSVLTESPTRVEIRIDRADVLVIFAEDPEHVLRVRGFVRGFGFPIHNIQDPVLLPEEAGPGTVGYRLKQVGRFTELTGNVVLYISQKPLEEVVVRVLQKGNIRVRNEGYGTVPELRLYTAEGNIEDDAAGQEKP